MCSYQSKNLQIQIKLRIIISGGRLLKYFILGRCTIVKVPFLWFIQIYQDDFQDSIQYEFQGYSVISAFKGMILGMKSFKDTLFHSFQIYVYTILAVPGFMVVLFGHLSRFMNGTFGFWMEPPRIWKLK